MKKWLIVTMTAAIMLCICSLSQAEDKKVIDKEFILVASYLTVSTVFDLESTFSALHRHGGREMNPIMRPFVEEGRLATYGIQFAINAVIMYAAYEMKGSKHDFFRKTWMITPMAMSTGHIIAGGLNCRYAW